MQICGAEIQILAFLFNTKIFSQTIELRKQVEAAVPSFATRWQLRIKITWLLNREAAG